LARWSAPLGLVARAMLGYVFIVEEAGKIGHYADVAGYMARARRRCAAPAASAAYVYSSASRRAGRRSTGSGA